MTIRMKLRRGLSSLWASVNPILGDGEPGYDKTGCILKIGDGISPWNDLAAIGGGEGSVGPQGPAGPTGPQGPAGANSTVLGPQGTQGVQGIQGEKGDPGTTDYNALSNKPTIPTALSGLSDDATHRLTTDTEKGTWNGKQAALGFTPIDAATKAAASGVASLDGSTILVQAIRYLLAGTGALTATDGVVGWQSTRKIQLIYDTQRERAASEIGWMPYAYPVGVGPTNLTATSLSLPAAGGCVACPVVLESGMLLQSVKIRSLDTSTARSWNWYLYEQYLNNGNAGENSLTQIAYGTAQENFTPSAASNRSINASSAPVYLPPGVYWLVIQNLHATSAFSLGTTAAGTMALNAAQTKTIAGALGSTLDFVAATWTKTAGVPGARLNGRVFGQTAEF